MRFKQWLEDTTGSADQYGNDVSPDDNGLVRQQYLTKQPPPSAHANQLFGRDYMAADPDLSYLLNPPGQVPYIGPETGEPVNHGIARFEDPYGSHRYVMYQNGQAVAAIQVVSKDRRSGAHLANVFTHPDHRRERYATQLLRQAQSDFRSIGFPPRDERSDSANDWLDGIEESRVDRSSEQRREIYRVLNHLLYNHGLEPDQIMGMSSSDLLPLVQHQRPTESWNMSRFLNMIKSAARSEIEQF